MNILTTGPQVLRVDAPAADLRRRGLELSPGTRQVARVVSVSDGRAVVNIGGETLVTQTDLPLREGQVVALLVEQGEGGALLLRLAEPVRAAPRAGLQLATEGAVLPRTDADIAEAVRAVGLPTSDDNLAAARALLDHGQALNKTNISFVARNAHRFEGPTEEVVAALAQARALDLPATEATVAALRAASRGTGLSLAERLDSIARLASDLQAALTDLTGAGAAPASSGRALTTEAGELLAALSRALDLLQGTATGSDGADARAVLAQRLSVLLATMEFGGVVPVAGHVLDHLASQLGQTPAKATEGSAPLLGRPLVRMAADIEASMGQLERFLTDTQPTTGLPSRLLAVLAAIDEALPSPGLPPAPAPASSAGTAGTVAAVATEGAAAAQPLSAEGQQVESRPPSAASDLLSRLATLRAALRAFSLPATPAPSATDLAEMTDRAIQQLASRVESTMVVVAAEAPADVEALVAALAQRAMAVRMPSESDMHPAVRLASLLEGVENALTALPADRASSSDALLSLRHQLQGIAAFLRESRGSTDVSVLAQRGAERVLEATAMYTQATERRVVDLREALATRTHRDALLVVARVTAATARNAAQGLARVEGLLLDQGPASQGGWITPTQLLALHGALDEAVVRVAQALAGLEALAEPIGQIDAGLGATAAALPEDGGPASPRSPEQLLQWLGRLQPLLTDPAMQAELPAEVAQSARALAVAMALEATRSVAAESARLTRLLESAQAHPERGTLQIHEDLRRLVELVGRSLENKLLSTDAARAVERDLRAVLGRLEVALERLVRSPSTAEHDPALAEQAQRLLSTVTSARSALEGQQLLNAVAPRTPLSHFAYVEVPVVVNGRQVQAQLKVLRDSGRAGEPLDPDNLKVALRLDTYTLGVVTALVEMRQGILNVEFSLDSPESEAVVDERLPELLGALQEGGLVVARLQTDVRQPGATDAFEALGEPVLDPFRISVLA